VNCAIAWIIEPKRRRLTRIEAEPEPELDKMVGQDRNGKGFE